MQCLGAPGLKGPPQIYNIKKWLQKNLNAFNQILIKLFIKCLGMGRLGPHVKSQLLWASQDLNTALRGDLYVLVTLKH